MPSINTLVADLDSGAIVGIGAKAPSDSTTDNAEISAGHALKWEAVDAAFSLSASNRLMCAVGGQPNGTYLHFAENRATVGKISQQRPILVSGNFSGCAYKVFRTPNVGLVGVHIARPGGTSTDANVTLVDDYATQKNWTEKQHIPSLGFIGNNGCSEVIMVSQLIGTNVHTAVLRVDTQGLRTGTTVHIADVS